MPEEDPKKPDLSNDSSSGSDFSIAWGPDFSNLISGGSSTPQSDETASTGVAEEEDSTSKIAKEAS